MGKWHDTAIGTVGHEVCCYWHHHLGGTQSLLSVLFLPMVVASLPEALLPPTLTPHQEARNSADKSNRRLADTGVWDTMWHVHIAGEKDLFWARHADPSTGILGLFHHWRALSLWSWFNAFVPSWPNLNSVVAVFTSWREKRHKHLTRLVKAIN